MPQPKQEAKSIAPIDFRFDVTNRAERPFQGDVYIAAAANIEKTAEDLAVNEAIRLANMRKLLSKEGCSQPTSLDYLNLDRVHSDLAFHAELAISSTEPLGGGVFGRVWKVDSVVAKTTKPSKFRSFWRTVNWGLAPFPSQYSKEAAEHDSLAAVIYHEVVKTAFAGQIETPRPYGFIFIANMGYVQILDFINFRGPRFDTNEHSEFTQMRKILKDFNYAVGFEQAAQIHPDSIGGLENIGWDPKTGKWKQPDLHSALKHTIFVWPGLVFPFHLEIRREFGDWKTTTYNKIHTDRLRPFLDRLNLSDVTRQNLETLIAQYEELRPRYEAVLAKPLKDKNLEAWVNLGEISPQRAERLSKSRLRYGAYILERSLKKAFEPIEKVHDWMHQKFRQVMLSGPETAHKKGLINDLQWESIQDQFSKQNEHFTPYFLYWASAFIYGRAKTIPAAALYGKAVGFSLSTLSLDLSTFDPLYFAAGVLIGEISPGIVRFATALTLGRLYKKDMWQAAKIGLIPKSTEIAISAQLRHDLKESGDIHWHYTKRKLSAGISKLICPWAGGLGTDADAFVWNTTARVTKRIKSLFGKR